MAFEKGKCDQNASPDDKISQNLRRKQKRFIYRNKAHYNGLVN